MLYWILRPFVLGLIRTIFRLCGGFRVEGKQNVPRTGGVMVTPNHISDCDPPAIGAALPRAMYMMAKEELFQIKIIGPFIRLARGFPVKRYTADRAALRYAEDRLKEGEAVVIFPEGKLSEDGTLLELLPGALMIAQRANVPILPTILLNSDKVMPYGKVKPQFAGVPTIVRFGPPISIETLTGGLKGSDGLKLGAKRLHDALQALQQNRPYPEFPPMSETMKETADTISA